MNEKKNTLDIYVYGIEMVRDRHYYYLPWNMAWFRGTGIPYNEAIIAPCCFASCAHGAHSPQLFLATRARKRAFI